VALLEKRRYLNNRSGDFPQVILIVPSHVPNNGIYKDGSSCSEPVFVNLFRSPGIDSQPGGIDSWAL
jgi:hypothetical protein